MGPGLVLAVVILPIEPVAVERSSGKVAVVRGEGVEVWAPDLTRREATLPAPAGRVELLEMVGGVVCYAFALPGEGRPARAAVGVESGIEKLIWPNPGIGEHFPALAARLTTNGAGLFEFLRLDPALRGELKLPEEIPDGAGTVATYRFADERVWAIAAADFVGAVALAPGDAVVVTAGGGVLRYRTGDGVVWRQEGDGQERRILDVDPQEGVLLLVAGRGLELLSLPEGRRRGVWRRADVVEAKLLSENHLLIATKAGEVVVGRPATGGGVVGEGSFPLLEGCSAGPAPCPGGASPLACLHPVPGGLLVACRDGWRRVSLPAPAGAPVASEAGGVPRLGRLRPEN